MAGGQKFLPPGPGRVPQVEIVVPVRDEERDLGPGIRRLAAYLSQRFPFRAVITIEMPAAVYTEELFATGDDDTNRAAVPAVAAESLVLAGIAGYGPRNAVDKVCRGLSLHP